MKFSKDYSRVGAFGRSDEDDDWDRTPEQDDELLNRDWPEASQPLKGGKLKWVEGGYWPSSGRDHDYGPHWVAKLTDIMGYHISSERHLEGEWNYTFTPDSYSYRFMAIRVVTPKPKRGKKVEKREDILGTADKLAEAQKMCEDDSEGYL